MPKMKYQDRRDPTRAEMLLTRAGHHILREARKKLWGTRSVELEAISNALDTLYAAKREVKAEIKAKNAESFKNWVRP